MPDVQEYRVLLSFGWILLLLDIFSIIFYRSNVTFFPQIVVLILCVFMIVYAIIQIRKS